ncbi:DUF916 domain-containing protein [Solwaraspora sp. WMMD406]|uniref:WxL protein peptidoglycan domain-containing protein n=1 Tax=Solwaraspora sp. WMMD406 TaxID=3016095 RepID=UPI002415A3C3|nr:DUF916 domain-containing protein [Solwaraspora sp. WMMD406]MDG4764172.1 DUF916 domain-containing protein [Solwaraspora sp. WMMD406]
MRKPAALATGLLLAAGLLAGPAPTVPPAPELASAAAQSLTWGVAPSSPEGPNGRPAFEYKLDPGATLTDYVAISNHSDQPITLDVYASDAFTTDQGGFDLLAADTASVDVGAWITLPARTITVPSTSRLDVPFTITVPDNATPGDHPGGIVASLAATGTDEQGNQVAVDHRVGSRVYLRVTGELRPALDVADLSITHDGTWNPIAGGTVTATFTVRNTGNVRLTGQPDLAVAGPFGSARRTASGDQLPEILPGDSFQTSVRVDGVPPLFRLGAQLTVEPAAVTDDVLDPAPVTVVRERGLWAVPWPHLVFLLLLGLVGWLVVARRRKSRSRQAAQLEQAVAAAREQGRAEAARDQSGTESVPDQRRAEAVADQTAASAQPTRTAD